MKKFYTTSSIMQLIKCIENAKGYDNSKTFDLNRAEFLEKELIEALVRSAEAKEIKTRISQRTTRQEAKVKFILNNKTLKYFLYLNEYEAIVRSLIRRGLITK